MESKNLKPRILDALDVIGKPATAREIASHGAIDEPIHGRLKELTDHGDLIRIQAIGCPIVYALPTMIHNEHLEANEDETKETEVTTTTTPMTTPERPAYRDIYAAIEAQKRNMDSAIEDYASRAFDGDTVYRSMIEARAKLQKVLAEMALCGMK